MATERVFYVVDWILENQFSVISTKDIVSPVKDIYEENEEITAKWGRGKSVYPARIVKKSENQDQLNAKLTEIIEEELQKKNAANGNEDVIKAVPKTKAKETATKAVKETALPIIKSTKRRKENLQKVADNLELVELAIEKNTLSHVEEFVPRSGESTPQKLSSPVLSTHQTYEFQSAATPRRSPRVQATSPYNRPSRSTSSVLKSAFQTLNPRDYENEIAMQQRINYLESWLTSLQQEVNQQRSYINWLCNEHQKQSLNLPKEPSTTQQSEACEAHEAREPQNSFTEQSGSQQTVRASLADNSFTKGQLNSLVETEGDFGKATRVLFRKLYSKEEVMGRSLKGQRPSKDRPAKPALENQEKLQMLYEVVMEKWPVVTKAMINGKLADLLKPSAFRS